MNRLYRNGLMAALAVGMVWAQEPKAPVPPVPPVPPLAEKIRT